MTLEEKVTEKVMQAVARVFKKDVSEISRDTRFIEDLKSKSLNVVELIALLENQLEVMIPFAEVRRTKTVGEAIDLMIKLRKG